MKNKGITLIALVITIVVLIILAGVTLNLTLGENGIFNKAEQASEKSKREAAREELEIAIMQIQSDIIEDNQSITMEEIVNRLKENENNLLEEEIQNLNTDGTGGRYKNYNFYIENETYNVIMGEKSEEGKLPQVIYNENVLALSKSTYIDTNITQAYLVANSEFTIAARVYINSEAQKTVNNMDILGNHVDYNGFAWQFLDETSIFRIVVIKESLLEFDYTPYYDKWTDIVMTYNNGNIKLFIDGMFLSSIENKNLIPYNNILIGTGFLPLDRAMFGLVQSVKIWGKELNETEVSKINYYEKNTTIQTQSIIKEFNFDSIEEIEEKGTLVGSNYKIVSNKEDYMYQVKLNGGCYLDVNLAQSEIIANSEFTIAARVKINQAEQQTVNHMDILGNHYSTNGLVWQFLNTTNTLAIYVYGRIAEIDYTPYYDKWTDIIMTYDNSSVKSYINGELISSVEDRTLIPYGNIMLGTGYLVSNRAMKGYLPYVKIWNVALTESEVSSLNMEQMNTSIQNDNLLKNLDLRTIENIREAGTFHGSGYILELVTE